MGDGTSVGSDGERWDRDDANGMASVEMAMRCVSILDLRTTSLREW